MTDALMDRIKAHRSAPDVYDPPTFDQMADHIDLLVHEANIAKKLVFVNSDATPKKMVIFTTKECVEDIMIMYGSHYAGDRYTVTFDGNKIQKDHNGWPK
jgi:hypothetical protein